MREIKKLFGLALIFGSTFAVGCEEALPPPETNEVTHVTDTNNLPKGNYWTVSSINGEFRRCVTSVVKTTHHYRNVVQDCGQESLNGLLAEDMQAIEIDLPEDIYRSDKGSYYVKVDGPDGERECVANLGVTTHGHKNIILSCTK